MRHRRNRRRRSRHKLVAVSISASFLIVAAGWGSLYAFADRLVRFSPANDALLATGAPVLAAKWATPGVRLMKARIFLDGDEISAQVTRTDKGFTYTPAAALAEGRHRVQATLDYRFLFPRRLKRTFEFSTDTVAPAIALDSAPDGVIGTAESTFTIAGKTEPGAKLKAKFAGKAVRTPTVSKDGQFVLKLKTSTKKSTLRLSTIDRAGNTYDKDAAVVLDTEPPGIVAVNPGPDTIVRATKPQVTVKINEPDSSVRTASLTIDGNSVPAGYDEQQQTLTFVPERFFDGAHKATVEVEDIAGNKNVKEWTFTVDTSHILVSLSQRKLFLHRGGQLISAYTVAIGQPEFPTPVGSWRIVRKRKNPSWINPGSDWAKTMPDKIPPGPDNPLGQRALDLNASGIRIHGTPSTRSIGTAASHGCIRMYPWNIEVLFDEVGIGTPVDITS